MPENQFKIAILSVHSSPLGQPGIGDTGGMSIYIREVSRELAKLGHTIDIFTRVQDPVTPEIIDLAPGARQIHILSGEPADIDKLQVYSHAPDFARKVEQYREQQHLKYDLIFSHYWISGIAGRYLQERWRVPQMVMFHTLGVIKNAIGIGENEPALRIEEEGQIARDSHRILASTDREKHTLYRFYDIPLKKISVIPCGVNLELFKPQDKNSARHRLGLDKNKIILFIGRIERLKGIDKIIRAMVFLRHLHPHLVIVGEDGNRPGELARLKNLAQEIGLNGSISFTGLKDYTDLPDYYNAADVCVFPSYYESFGLVPLESLACGTPVVATDVGDLQHIIRHGVTGYVVTDSQPLGLAEKIDLILSGQNPLIADSSTISHSVARFGWQHIAASIDHEFNDLLLNPGYLSMPLCIPRK